jgi:hypothetical protein
MINAVSNVANTEPVAPVTGTSTQKATQGEPKASGAVDSVQLSKTAQATLAALQELTETAAQTAKEAGHGDLQAQRLLTKEAAAKSLAE